MPDLIWNFKVQGQQTAAQATAALNQHVQQLQQNAQANMATWERFYASMGKELKSVTNNVNLLNNGQIQLNRTFQLANQNMGRQKLAMLELSRGFEDFSVMVGQQGFAGGMRGALNNISQFATVAGGPAVGAIAGLGGALAITLLPLLRDTGKEARRAADDLLYLVNAQTRLDTEAVKRRYTGQAENEVKSAQFSRNLQRMARGGDIEGLSETAADAEGGLKIKDAARKEIDEQIRYMEFNLGKLTGTITGEMGPINKLISEGLAATGGAGIANSFTESLNTGGAGTEVLTQEDINGFLERVRSANPRDADMKSVFLDWQAERSKRFGQSGERLADPNDTTWTSGAIPKEVMDQMVKSAEELQKKRREGVAAEDDYNTAQKQLKDSTEALARAREKATSELFESIKNTLLEKGSEVIANATKRFMKAKKEGATVFEDIVNDSSGEQTKSDEYVRQDKIVRELYATGQISQEEGKSARRALLAQEKLRKLGNRGTGFIAPERGDTDLTGKFTGIEDLYKRVQESAAGRSKEDEYTKAMKEHREAQRKEHEEAKKQRAEAEKVLKDNLPKLKEINTRLSQGIPGVLTE